MCVCDLLIFLQVGVSWKAQWRPETSEWLNSLAGLLRWRVERVRLDAEVSYISRSLSLSLYLSLYLSLSLSGEPALNLCTQLYPSYVSWLLRWRVERVRLDPEVSHISRSLSLYLSIYLSLYSYLSGEPELYLCIHFV